MKLAPGTFVGLTELKYLDVGVNALRTVSTEIEHLYLWYVSDINYCDLYII